MSKKKEAETTVEAVEVVEAPLETVVSEEIIAPVEQVEPEVAPEPAKKRAGSSAKKADQEIPPLKKTREFGDRGADIMWAQTKLQELGFAIGAIDGRFDTHLSKALRVVQDRAGLKVNGMLTPPTYEALKGM